MTEMDFVIFHIYHFTAEEVKATGADLCDVNHDLMRTLEKLRKLIRRRIGLLPNGLTTGDHKAKEHAQGLAADCFLYEDDGKVTGKEVIEKALEAGFRGVGAYYNNSLRRYSFHFDLRRQYKFWGGVKQNVKDKWLYFDLLSDPKEYVFLARKGGR